MQPRPSVVLHLRGIDRLRVLLRQRVGLLLQRGCLGLGLADLRPLGEVLPDRVREREQDRAERERENRGAGRERELPVTASAARGEGP